MYLRKRWDGEKCRYSSQRDVAFLSKGVVLCHGVTISVTGGHSAWRKKRPSGRETISRKGGIYSCTTEEVCGRGFYNKDEGSNRELGMKEQDVSRQREMRGKDGG